MSKLDINKSFLKLAYKELNPDLNSLDGLEQALKNWYCFQYNVPPNDDKLLDMTVEELFVLNKMHKLRENPELAEEITIGDKTSYEDWLKEEMGDDYVDSSGMVKQAELIEQEEYEFIERTKERLPERIDTDFRKIIDKE